MENNNDALMSDNIECLAAALSKAQASMGNVAKDKQAYGYKHADLAGCIAAVKKPLADNGLSFSQLVSQDKDGKQVLVTLLIHESGQWLKSMFVIETVVMKSSNSLQQLGAGITYTRRYALCAITGLAQDDDDDAVTIGQVTQREQELVGAKELMNLCLIHRIDATKFAKFCDIDSKRPETITNGIDNFISLKEQFLNASSTNIL